MFIIRSIKETMEFIRRRIKEDTISVMLRLQVPIVKPHMTKHIG